jgi:hypothetical protein
MTGDSPITLDEFRVLHVGLAAAAKALDREIEASGAVDRVTSRVMARIAPRRTRRAIWFAIAATLVIAAGLGSVADLALNDARVSAAREVVVLDPLVFGTAVVEQR